MFPSRPILDLASANVPFDSNSISNFFLILGIWCFGWLLLYLTRDYLNGVAFMAIITPTLIVAFSSGVLFWLLLIMTLINAAALLYNERKS